MAVMCKKNRSTERGSVTTEFVLVVPLLALNEESLPASAAAESVESI